MESQENSDSSSATSGCSGVTDTPAVSRNVQGTPSLDRIKDEVCKIMSNIPKYGFAYCRLRMLHALICDEIEKGNTAGDTKSSSAGVP